MTQPDSESIRELTGLREQPQIDLYARLEGLAGEEEALLAVPHHHRSEEQHARLHALERELDRAFERLHKRHARRRPTD